MKTVANILSWLLYIVALVIGVPALAVAHVSEVLGDLADEWWERAR